MSDKEPKIDKSALDGLEEEVAAARKGEPAERFDTRSALENLNEEVTAARHQGERATGSSVLDGLEEEVFQERQKRDLPPASEPRRSSSE